MEIHHHPHVSNKHKWKEYTFQFLMLFLAVFLGSLAEYRLEHYLEHQRTEKLAKALYAELRIDSATAQYRVDQKRERLKHLQHLENYFIDSNLKSPSSHFFVSVTKGLIQTRLGEFEPKEGILNQLKNSGSLRYFKEKEFQISIGEITLYIFRINRLNNDMAMYHQDHIEPFLLKHYSFRSHDLVTTPGKAFYAKDLLNSFSKAGNPSLIEVEKIKRHEISNIISRYRRMIANSLEFELVRYSDENKRLAQFLRSNYNAGN